MPLPEIMRGRVASMALTAVSVASGIPVADIDAYILITVDNDGNPRLSSNACCARHVIDQLQAAASDLEDMPDWANLVRHH